MKSNPRILHINSYFSTRTFYKHLYKEQIDNNLDIDVYVPVPKTYKKSDFDYGDYTEFHYNHGKYDRIIYHLKHAKILKDVKTKYDVSSYQVLHAHSLFSNGLIAYELFKEYGVPYVVAVRSSDVNTFFKWMVHLRSTGIKIMENASRIIFLSSSYAQQVLSDYVPKELHASFEKKISIIPNGIDDFWFENHHRYKIESNSLKLLHVGDINHNKNVLTTGKVVNKLRESGMDVEFNVVGPIISQKVFSRLGKVTSFNYLGKKDMDELKEIYRKNHVLVLPSLNETFGLVYAEAMSQATPVIYTRGQGFDQQFDDGVVGFSVNPKDVDEIASKILQIMDNYEKISKNCVELVDKFNWNRIALEYKELYYWVLSKEG